MNLEERIKAFSALGAKLTELMNPGGNDAGKNEFRQVLEKANQKNQWFTPSSVINSFTAIKSWLKKETIERWIQKYESRIDSSPHSSQIGVIMAGNIPMVGFHDLLCALISGNIFQAKCSADDAELLPYLCKLLIQEEQRFKECIRFTERLEKPDAVIATGGNNSARYFEFYFGKQPHIIRKNRNAVAVLDGSETISELALLGEDIFSYYGLGCRNVSKLYVPAGYDFGAFFKAMENQAAVLQHNKYMNNYDYHNTLFLLNGEKFLTNNFLILREHNQIPTPVSVLHYEYYHNRDEVNDLLQAEKEKIQCVVGNGFIPFGKSQSPALNDYADGIDVMEFLLQLK